MPTQTLNKPINIETTDDIPKDARPFYYPAGNRAVMFIHGFTDSLCRVNGFAKFLAKNGITTRGILLPGHGYGWEELAKTNPNDWYKEVEQRILELAKTVKEIYVVGISFGGNLALKFDAKYPGVLKGIVCIETPMSIRYQPITKAAIPFAQLLGFKYWNKQYLKKVRHPDKETVFKKGVLPVMPLVNIAQVIEFMEKRQGFMKKVTCDVMVIHSEKSNIIGKDSAKIILDSISSKRKEEFVMENVYHAFLSEPAKRTIYYEACKFFGIKY